MRGPRLGAHMSIAGGPANALLRGQSIHCDTIQMFTRNPNRWASKDLSPEDIQAFHEAKQATRIEPIVAHSSYLINLGTPDEELWRKSIQALVVEMTRCQQLGIRDYVLHPGSHTESGEEEGLARVAQALDMVLEELQEPEVDILLEITAGQGSSLGYRFEHFAWVMEHAEMADRLGVCFDTAHALAAGYEYRQLKSYRAMWREFDEIIGLRRLRAIHLNDALNDLGSQIDRHEQIGKGCLGLEAFRLLINDPDLRDVPMILETPKSEDLHEDVENLAILRGLIEGD